MERSLRFSVLLFCFSVCLCFSADQIKQLPGLQKNATFSQYSGYLTVGKGRYLHYWFVESQSKQENDPLLLWLNGGPGCSSLIGLLSENGPFRVINDGKTVVDSEFSWNKVANVLYLESPAGVGFSYDLFNSSVSDDLTAEDNYRALEAFYEKFPQFMNNSFYITGESYAGVYIPMLALKIFEKNSTINLKGLAIGNGLFDYRLLTNSPVLFAYTHGLIDGIEWNTLLDNCCNCSTKGVQDLSCDFGSKNYEKCNTESFVKRVIDYGLNVYNIYTDCKSLDLYSYDSPYRLRLKTFLGLNNQAIDDLAQNEILSNIYNCVDYNGYKEWLNSNEVRKALNIADNSPKWDQCSRVSDRYIFQYKSMREQVIDLIEKFKINKFIVYNGDIDFACDFIGDQQFVDGLGLKLIEKYKKWSVGGRTAGFVKRYEGISFMTVRNSGHMVPMDQPEAAFAILKELIGITRVA